MENENIILAKNLIAFRVSAGLTQFELAQKINYTDKTVSKWERAQGVPDIFVLKKLAALYNVKIDDFFIESSVIKDVQIEKSTRGGNRILIALLSAGLVWLVATIVFVVLNWIGVSRAWLTFVFAVPACFIVLIVFSSMWWKLYMTGIFVSGLVWTAVIPVSLILNVKSGQMLYFICIPLQVLVVLWYLLMYRLKKRKMKKST